MRRDELRRWRSRAGWAVAIGVLGGLVLAVWAVFWGAVNGLGSMGCGGSSGCEERMLAANARDQLWFYLALFGGGGLAAAGIATRLVLGKRLRALDPAPLPVATVVQRPESGREKPVTALSRE